MSTAALYASGVADPPLWAVRTACTSLTREGTALPSSTRAVALRLSRGRVSGPAPILSSGTGRLSVRNRVERRIIRGRSIIVIVEGKRMGRSGRKRKEGQREANGQIKRASTTQAALNELNAREIAKNRAVVVAQPHRRGSDDPRLGDALGRFCVARRLSKEVYDGCDEYAKTHKRWSAAIETPRGFENRTLGGTTEGPSGEQVKRWKATIDRIDLMLIRSYPHGISRAVTSLVIDDRDVPQFIMERDLRVIVSALYDIAVETGTLRSNPHPFH